MQCKYMQSSQIYGKHATWCRVHPLFGKNQSLSFARKFPTVIDVIKRHFLELVTTREEEKKRQKPSKENDYACSKVKNMYFDLIKAGATQTETSLLKQYAAGERVDLLDDVSRMFLIVYTSECLMCW